MAMFHCTDKKIALKGNLADYIKKRTGFMMNPGGRNLNSVPKQLSLYYG